MGFYVDIGFTRVKTWDGRTQIDYPNTVIGPDDYYDPDEARIFFGNIFRPMQKNYICTESNGTCDGVPIGQWLKEEFKYVNYVGIDHTLAAYGVDLQPGELLINIGTAGQVATLTEHGINNPRFDNVKFFDGNMLSVYRYLPGGNLLKDAYVVTENSILKMYDRAILKFRNYCKLNALVFSGGVFAHRPDLMARFRDATDLPVRGVVGGVDETLLGLQRFAENQ